LLRRNLEHQLEETQRTGHGRPVSWLAVSWITVAFNVGGIAVGGIALCTDPPTRWLFWTAAGVTSAGLAFAFAVDLMADFTTDDTYELFGAVAVARAHSLHLAGAR
jgi:hypothetical protein